MTDFDFDRILDRRASDSLKWSRYADPRVLPLWVADMDFAAPPAVTAALGERCRHSVFGYTVASNALAEAVCRHLEVHYRWRIEPAWLVWLPGLVSGLNLACRMVGRPGDAVLTAVPVYPPFLSAPGHWGLKLQTVPLVRRENCWHLDLERMEAAIEARTRLLLLCSPHNPVGRAFTTEELTALADMARRHDLIICSDEIHCDLILEPGRCHAPIATLDAQTAARTITLMAPSKTYNIPGLGCAFAVIGDAELRRRFRRAMAGIVPDVNLFGYTGALAALTGGEDWRQAVIAYLRVNRDLVWQRIAAMPGLETTPVEATYLAWIDARARGWASPAAVFERAGVGLSDGAEFGAPGFVRLNFGCPRALLEEALNRMQRALA
jgi:cystathionine beta-lyase